MSRTLTLFAVIVLGVAIVGAAIFMWLLFALRVYPMYAMATVLGLWLAGFVLERLLKARVTGPFLVALLLMLIAMIYGWVAAVFGGPSL